jgi:predicted secreted acid phosphatase
VLDADETVINNVTYQLERAQQGLPYSSESWAAWVRRREASPIPGAAAFWRACARWAAGLPS